MMVYQDRHTVFTGENGVGNGSSKSTIELPIIQSKLGSGMVLINMNQFRKKLILPKSNIPEQLAG